MMTRLLVVDDSAVMRRMIAAIFEAEVDMTVAFARSGEEALEMLPDFCPDVITLDVIMPGMDGLTCLSRIIQIRPCPVLMVSGVAAKGARDGVEALGMGAFDLIQKPQGALSPTFEPFASDLRQRVRTAVRASDARPRPVPHPSACPPQARIRPLPAVSDPRFPIVLLGASTGGPVALSAILAALPADFPGAVVICQHMAENFTGQFAARLDRLCALPVMEVTGDALLRPGQVYLGRGGADMILARDTGRLIVRSVAADTARLWHPSTDRLVESAIEVVDPRRLVGLLITGMGHDGAAAMTDLRNRGGRTIAEAEATAIVWGMPKALVDRDGADKVVPLPDIPSELTSMVRRQGFGTISSTSCR